MKHCMLKYPRFANPSLIKVVRNNGMVARELPLGPAR